VEADLSIRRIISLLAAAWGASHASRFRHWIKVKNRAHPAFARVLQSV
jgi:hypothetical protein